MAPREGGPKFVAALRAYQDYPKNLLSRSHHVDESQLFYKILNETMGRSFRPTDYQLLSTPVLDFDFELEQGSTSRDDDIKDSQTLINWLARQPTDSLAVPPLLAAAGTKSQEQSRNNSVSFNIKEGNDSGKSEEGTELQTLSRTRTPPRTQLIFHRYETYRKDPKCRFIFLNSQTSRSPLNIDIHMFRLLMSFHQVMPEFLDFISVFGNEDARGERFCSFNVHKQLKISVPPTLPVDKLGRSGRYYQICYNFRSPSPLGTDAKRATFRQAIFHHQFDVVEGSAVWITAKGKSEKSDQSIKETIENRFIPTVKSTPPRTLEDYFRLTLDVHVLNCGYAIINWRGCIETIEEHVDDFQQDLGPDPLSSGKDSEEYIAHVNPGTLRKAQIIEENIVNVILVLKSNIDTLKSLSSFYNELVSNHDDEMAFKTKAWHKDVKNFGKDMESFEKDIQRLIIRTERLAKVAGDSKSIVIKRMEFLSSSRMETLTKETVGLGQLAQKEAVAVRVITIVTLLYLPASVVSSFFSTDVIKYQNEGSTSGSNEPSFSRPALHMWLKVTIPFTVGTLLVGFLIYRFERGRQRKALKGDEESLQQTELVEQKGKLKRNTPEDLME